MNSAEPAMITNEVTVWRKRKGVSKAHLARRINVSRSYVTRLEQGALQPSGEVMFRISKYLGCGIDALFHWKASDKDASGRLVDEATRTPSIEKPYGSPAAEVTRQEVATHSARPAGIELETDKSLVNPAAKGVASPIA